MKHIEKRLIPVTSHTVKTRMARSKVHSIIRTEKMAWRKRRDSIRRQHQAYSNATKR